MGRNIKRTWKKADNNNKFERWFQNLLLTYKKQRYFRKNSQLYSVGHLGIRKWILAQTLPEEQQALRNILIDAMDSANKACPGSEIWIPAGLSGNLQTLGQRYGSSLEYENLVCDMSHDEKAISVFRETIKYCGPLTKISIRLGDYNEPFLRYKSSYSFPIEPCSMFTNTLGKTHGYELSNPEVFMIEGAPSTLAEIEPLIYRHVETSRPIVIIARHYPEEISATLATNFKTGKLKIIPLIYGKDINTVNMAADIMSVSGGELVSVHFGDIISASCGDDSKYGNVERVEVTQHGVDIDSEADTSLHVKSLMNKLNDLDDDEEPLKEIIGNRIHSLTNDTVVVHIPKAQSQLHEEVDAMFKMYSAFVQSGITVTQWGAIPTSVQRVVNRIADSTNYELSRIAGFLLETKE